MKGMRLGRAQEDRRPINRRYFDKVKRLVNEVTS